MLRSRIQETDTERLMADRVVLATGSLFAQGAITPGPLGGRLCCNQHGAVVDSNNRSSNILSNVGPARLGTLLESIAIPELRQQAAALAETLTSSFAN